MNKISTFLIVVVLIARGALYIYDQNKSKIDNLVSQSNPATTEEIVNRENPGVDANGTQGQPVSPFTLTFILSGNNEIYYYNGEFNGNLNILDYNTIGIFIKTYKDAVNPDDLMFIIKADKSSTFKNMVDVLDEMDKNEVPAGHFAEREITKKEIERIKLLKETKNG